MTSTKISCLSWSRLPCTTRCTTGKTFMEEFDAPPSNAPPVKANLGDHQLLEMKSNTRALRPENILVKSRGRNLIVALAVGVLLLAPAPLNLRGAVQLRGRYPGPAAFCQRTSRSMHLYCIRDACSRGL